MIADALCWVSGSAFLLSIIKHTFFLEYFGAPFVLILLTVAAGALYALFKIPDLAGAISFRAVLLIIGFVLEDIA